MRMILISLLIAMGLSLTSVAPVTAGPVEEGKAAYEAEDYSTALRLWKQAAEQGNADAQYGLGDLYLDGLGVEQDYAQALNWYRKAADQGNAQGQIAIGYLYRLGKGVLQDYVESVKWYRLAAEQGNANAQYVLGSNYHAGRGVPQDNVQAHMWLNLAAAQGRFAAGEFRNGIAADMTPQEIEEAQRLAREWIAAHPK